MMVEPLPGSCCAYAALAPLLLNGCDHQIASEKNVDVCVLAPVTTALQEVPITESGSGACLLRTNESKAVQIDCLEPRLWQRIWPGAAGAPLVAE